MEWSRNGNGPSAEQVHRRALALAYLACRAMVDADPRAEEMACTVQNFVREVGLEDAFEPAELRMLQAPFGSFSDFELVETRWLVEGISVLAWALGKVDLPPFSTKCSAAPASIALGMFRLGTKERLGEASLRKVCEIESLALTYLALHWRIGWQIDSPGKMDFAAQLKAPDHPHLLVDGLELHDGDLTIDGKELGQVAPERFGEVFAIVRQRFNAFKWLQGRAARYGADTTLQENMLDLLY